jgi:hypothetical protein
VSTISKVRIVSDNATFGVRRTDFNEVEVSFAVKDDLISVVMSDLQASNLLAGLLMAFSPRNLAEELRG